MTALYILAAIVGLPLVAYAVFSGDSEAGELDVGDLGGDFGEVDVGDVGGDFMGALFAYLSIGTLAFFFGFFGLAGLVAELTGAGTVLALVLAITTGLAGAVTHRGLLNYIKRTSSSSHIGDHELSGRIATVVLPIAEGHRGRIAVEIGEQRSYFTAVHVDGEQANLAPGHPVVIVRVDQGVAVVTGLDPELA